MDRFLRECKMINLRKMKRAMDSAIKAIQFSDNNI